MAQADREALGALYNATGGPNWKRAKNWNTGADLSEWHGITTNDHGRVVGLALTSNNLQGSIPPELGELAALQYLDLSDNQLTGHIPRQLGDLGALRYLALNDNKLDGHIPPQLGQLGALQSLSLGGNKLDGPIPRELGNLAVLQYLNLQLNELSGPIPKELGELSRLEKLWLSGNNLTGPIPKELGELSRLEKLWLYGNNLTGRIPPELAKLVALEKLSLGYNRLSGHIPPQLGQLGALQVLALFRNKLDGPIPKELGELSRLEKLWLYGNNLTGHIPPQLGQLGALEYLDLSNNKLNGHIPSDLGNLSALQKLHLSFNQLSGSVPAQFVKLYGLDALSLDGNLFSGPVPSMGELRRLFAALVYRAPSAQNAPLETAGSPKSQRTTATSWMSTPSSWMLPPSGWKAPLESAGSPKSQRTTATSWMSTPSSWMPTPSSWKEGSALSTMMEQRKPHGKPEARTTEDHLYDEPDTSINARMAAMLAGSDETGAVQRAQADEMRVGKMAGAASAKKGGRTTATSVGAATTGGEPRYSEDERLKTGTTHTTSQMSSLQDFKGDVVAWSFGNRAEVLHSPDSEFELEVRPGLNKNYPALIGLRLCSGSAETVNGEQHLLHCVLTCLTQAGEEFDPPLLLRFPVGDEESMESGSLDGSQDDAEEAYRAHLKSTFSAVKRDDASSEWVPIGGDIVRMKEGGDFFLEVKISHFCEFGLSQTIDVREGYTELIPLPKKMFQSRKTHYHFANLGTNPLVFYVWGASRKKSFVNVARGNVKANVTGGGIGGEVERSLVDVPGSGPYKVDVPGGAGGGRSPQVCKQFVDLEKPTVAWTTQEQIPQSAGVEGHRQVQVWGIDDMKPGHVFVVGAMEPNASPDVANLKVKDGESVGKLVWSKVGNN